ncbi:angiogenic factor with g patch and fha domains 1 [Plakobranchus ocellatus]|uniref:Angiogenic factor with g patch and fha domains 1 n=1 Tax=Plakobranchus ocellatus TaxID=259542 RepID=A0AAV4ACW4_9GAST|nr:angiogenic factor with g patch and fha domains 1 [Plakobranchus ocellatus]
MNTTDDILRNPFCERSLEEKLEIKKLGLKLPPGPPPINDLTLTYKSDHPYGIFEKRKKSWTLKGKSANVRNTTDSNLLLSEMDDQETLKDPLVSCDEEALTIHTPSGEDENASIKEPSSTSETELLNIIKAKDIEIKALSKRAEKAERLLEKAYTYNEDLKSEIASLGSELHEYRSFKKNGKSIPLQVSEKDIEEAYGEKPMPTWGHNSSAADLSVSIAESLKAAAEEVVQDGQSNFLEQETQSSSDYVYDAQTGFYYHPASGYYWDPSASLFYDYTTGTYYQYNETTGEYAVHSQVDFTGNANSQKLPMSDKDGERETKVLPGKRKRKFKRSRKHKVQKWQPVTMGEEDGIITDETSGIKMVGCKNSEEHIHSSESEKMLSEKREVNVIEISDSGDESSGSLATGESELVSSPESGEISDGPEENANINAKVFSAYPLTYDQQIQYTNELAENHPPCIRLIVLQSEYLQIGSLSIITCAGGTIGREPNMGHIIEISDLNISKVHAQVHYDYECNCYNIIDKGSQNGTFLNGKRLSESKQESAAYPLSHEDILEIGSTRFLLHIHSGHDTCEDCEPGQVQAKLRALNPIKNDHIVLSKDEKNRHRLKELKQLRKKYGLQNSYFENTGANISNSEYCDKAYLRRKYVGSEPVDAPNTSADMPASTQNPISASNKGHKLLSKMGWKEGEGLGKTNSGIAAPVNVELRVNQNAGLGSPAGFSLSLDNVHKSRKAKNWSMARQMYDKLEAQDSQTNKLATQNTVNSDSTTRNISQCVLPSTTSAAPLTFHSDDTGPPYHKLPQSAAWKTSSSSHSSLKKFSSVPKISWVKGETQKPLTLTADSMPESQETFQ